jgi:hypothetical protein
MGSHEPSFFVAPIDAPAELGLSITTAVERREQKGLPKAASLPSASSACACLAPFFGGPMRCRHCRCVWTRFHNVLFRQVVILARPYPRAELQRSRLDPVLPFRISPVRPESTTKLP